MCMIDGAEPCEVYEQTSRRARIEHHCAECARLISPGEQYEVATMLYEGRWDTYKTCRHCIAVREWLVIVCNGFCHHGVQDDLLEHAFEGYNPRFLNIAVGGMRKGWRKPDGTLRREMSLPKNLPVGV